ncbi:hypothetical protein AAE478_010094 [Parahypoxylon ruwenzoriense]
MSRENRHDSGSKSHHYPTQYIINDGSMTVHERALRHSNAVIYNAPGSSLQLVSSPPKPTSTDKHHNHHTYHAPPGYYSERATTRTITSPPIQTCHGCLEQREMYSGGYCYDCSSGRLERRLKDRQGRHTPPEPEKKLLGWR